VSTLARVARLAWAAPGALIRTLVGKLLARTGRPRQPRVSRVGQVRWEFPVHLDPLVRLMYWGAYEAFTVVALRRLLRPGDTFLDIGANVGYLSAIGADRVGPTGQVHAFEPMPAYAAWVERLRDLNPDRAITVNRCAVGDAPGEATLNCTATANLGWNTLVPGLMAGEPTPSQITVPVITLGGYLTERAATLGRVGCIKIDVEGYELPVLVGMADWLRTQSPRPPILCEVAPVAYPAMGRSLQELEDLLRSLGYEATDLEAWGRPVALTALRETTMVVLRPPR